MENEVLVPESISGVFVQAVISVLLLHRQLVQAVRQRNNLKRSYREFSFLCSARMPVKSDNISSSQHVMQVVEVALVMLCTRHNLHFRLITHQIDENKLGS